MMYFTILFSFLLLGMSRCHQPRDHCDIPNSDKEDCAPNEGECNSKGCCWVPVEKNSSSTRDTPWCFYPTDMTHPPDPCEGDVFNWVASYPGFPDDIYDVMYQKYKA